MSIILYGSNQKFSTKGDISASRKANSSSRTRFSLLVTAGHSVFVEEDSLEDELKCWENEQDSANWVASRFWKDLAAAATLFADSTGGWSFELETLAFVTEL